MFYQYFFFFIFIKQYFILKLTHSFLNNQINQSVGDFFAGMQKKYLLYCKSEFRTKTKNKERQWNNRN